MVLPRGRACPGLPTSRNGGLPHSIKAMWIDGAPTVPPGRPHSLRPTCRGEQCQTAGGPGYKLIYRKPWRMKCAGRSDRRRCWPPLPGWRAEVGQARDGCGTEVYRMRNAAESSAPVPHGGAAVRYVLRNAAEFPAECCETAKSAKLATPLQLCKSKRM